MKNKAAFILLRAAAILIPLFSSAQHVQIPADKMLLHHETVGDPYLPNAYNNKKTSPAYKSSTASIRNTGVFTIQVNVDSNGQNIIGDAANEPNIAVNPLNENEIVIGWRQFDNVSDNFRQAGWSYTSDAGQTWTFPGVIEPGIFRSDPVLDYDGNGNFYYNSLTIDGGIDYHCKVFKSTNGGALWDNGVDAHGGDKAWMAIDRTAGIGNGNIYSCWDAVSSCTGTFTRSTNGGNTFEDCIAVDNDPTLGTMAVGNDGELYISGGGFISASNILVVKSLNAQISGSLISWDTSVYITMNGYIGSNDVNPDGLLGQANIDVDRSDGPGEGNVYVAASVKRVLSNTDPADVMFSRSTDGGLTWSAPIRVNDDSSLTNVQWFGTMSVALNGRIDMIWLDTRDAPLGSDSSALYYSFSTDQGSTWSVNEKLSDSFDPHVGYPNQNKMGDYFDMISDSSGAHLAWANTLNGEEDVYYSHIVPQIIIGVNEIANHSTTSIFPNPASATITLSLPSNQNAILSIFNLLGEKVKEEKVTGSQVTIDVSSLPQGVYLVKTENKMLGKFMKE